MPYADSEDKRKYFKRYYHEHREELKARSLKRQRAHQNEVNAAARRRHKRDPKKERNRCLLKWYGLSREKYEQMLACQKGRCL